MWCATDISRAVLKILHEARKERVSVDTSDRTPGSQEIGQPFLRVDENKEELFLYLAEQLTTIGTDHGEVVSTKHESVVFNNDRN